MSSKRTEQPTYKHEASPNCHPPANSRGDRRNRTPCPPPKRWSGEKNQTNSNQASPSYERARLSHRWDSSRLWHMLSKLWKLRTALSLTGDNIQEYPPTPGAVFHGTRHKEQRRWRCGYAYRSLYHVITHLWNVLPSTPMLYYPHVLIIVVNKNLALASIVLKSFWSGSN